MFFSPLLSPTIWHPNLIRLATSESIYGPGWWRDIRSLDLGPMEELKKTGWKGYWNESIVRDARACIADVDTMTVVLTGRRYHPFHQLIPDMLTSKGLQFDLVGLRPDPESVSEYQWEGEQSTQAIYYNLTGSVFQSTMHFKTCFILNILHKIQTIKNVVMWDDRFPHVKRFKEFLDAVKLSGVINESQVIYVPGIRPKYNPEWEKRVIGHIIETHNKALLEYQTGKKKTGKIMERLEWALSRPEDPLSAANEKLLEITPQPAQTVIALSASCIHNLQSCFASLFKSQMERNKRSQWKVFGGEKPEFFGDYVYLSQTVLPSTSIPLGPVGTKVQVPILAYSISPRIPCLLLQVQVAEQQCILPLWYKPSEFFDLFRLKNIRWQPIRSNHRSFMTEVQGEINYAYRLGVIETPLRMKRPLSPKDDISPIPTSRLRTHY